jgi:hydrogenase 3 maturation protease
MADSPIPAPEPAAWEAECLRLLGPRPVVAGVGNRDRGDDGVGPVVAEGLRRAGLVAAFDCGTAPENYLGPIVALNPTDVIFVDAADLDSSPGTVRLFGAEQLRMQAPSTHAAGLPHGATFLAKACAAACRLLAVQPADTKGCSGLSPPVRAAADRILASPVWQRSSAPGPMRD